MKNVLIGLLILIIFTSGCIQETGKVIQNKSFSELNISNRSFQTHQTSKPVLTQSHISKPKCPESCDDGDPCTKDVCSEKTRYLCQHYIQRPCCGNGVCEKDESFQECPEDCKPEKAFKETPKIKPKESEDECLSDSDCKDSNPCTKDICSGSPKKCMHLEIKECVSNDERSPEGCDYSLDSDYKSPWNSVFISEIMYSPLQNQNYNEWIEIYNPLNKPVNLSGWMLCKNEILPGYIDRNGTLHNDKGYLLPSHTFAIITDGGSGTEVYDNFQVASHSFSFHVNGSTLCGRLSDKGKTITLFNKNHEVVDSVTYTNEFGYKNGKSIVRTPSGWKEGEDQGTPGY